LKGGRRPSRSWTEGVRSVGRAHWSRGAAEARGARAPVPRRAAREVQAAPPARRGARAAREVQAAPLARRGAREVQAARGAQAPVRYRKRRAPASKAEAAAGEREQAEEPAPKGRLFRWVGAEE